MPYETLSPNLTDVPKIELNDAQRKSVRQMAAVGSTPEEIAAAIGLTGMEQAVFVLWSCIEGSEISALIAGGKAVGNASPRIKLQEAAAAGNVEAARTLLAMQEKILYHEILKNIDDDEFTMQAVAH